MRLDRWGSSVISHRKSDGSCAFVAGKGVSPLGITVLWSCGEDFLGGRVSAPPYLEKSVRTKVNDGGYWEASSDVVLTCHWMVGRVGGRRSFLPNVGRRRNSRGGSHGESERVAAQSASRSQSVTVHMILWIQHFSFITRESQEERDNLELYDAGKSDDAARNWGSRVTHGTMASRGCHGMSHRDGQSILLDFWLHDGELALGGGSDHLLLDGVCDFGREVLDKRVR